MTNVFTHAHSLLCHKVYVVEKWDVQTCGKIKRGKKEAQEETDKR